MSYCGFDDPNRQPLTVFSLSVIALPGSATLRSVSLPMETSTITPRLPVIAKACPVTAASASPIRISALSAPSPQVISVTTGCASSKLAKVWVAPNCLAHSSLRGSGSIATT